MTEELTPLSSRFSEALRGAADLHSHVRDVRPLLELVVKGSWVLLSEPLPGTPKQVKKTLRRLDTSHDQSGNSTQRPAINAKTVASKTSIGCLTIL